MWTIKVQVVLLSEPLSKTMHSLIPIGLKYCTELYPMNPHKLYVTTCKMSPLTNEHASGED